MMGGTETRGLGAPCVPGTEKVPARWVRARPEEGWLRPLFEAELPPPPPRRPNKARREPRLFLEFSSVFNYNIIEQGEGL